MTGAPLTAWATLTVRHGLSKYPYGRCYGASSTAQRLVYDATSVSMTNRVLRTPQEAIKIRIPNKPSPRALSTHRAKKQLVFSRRSRSLKYYE
jgi:hypothetical protein